MKTLKIIFGILLIVGGIGSLVSFFQAMGKYEAPELIGHLIAIAIVFGLAYFLLKRNKK
ncbi:hypothetical protein KO494_11450 [Lacinutrix sp. C3R15]|uniref:hypothetical protein n=1 Tax=Flavobacteriaceae TaxID=49546 RepID=UPI001C08A0A3|nr:MULTISPECIES: hypothetical protein [Flavobacteriaceae]MBU2940151.1 hypothetical protein [Lacinutrix sp. C3R15]MDO6623468.1 hypothetical protein [Oceanihabitans sp. 1_MG-2023]